MFGQVTKYFHRRPQNIKETKSPSRIIEGQCGWGYQAGHSCYTVQEQEV